MTEPEGGKENDAVERRAAPEPSTLPEVAVLEAALRRWLSEVKAADRDVRAVREAIRQGADHEMPGWDTAGPVAFERDLADQNRVRDQQLSAIVARWSARSESDRASVAEVDDAVRGLVRRSHDVGLSPADRAEVEQSLDGLLMLVAARRDQRVGRARFADGLRRGSDPAQGSFTAVASLIDGSGEDLEVLDRWEALIRTVPGRPPAPTATPPRIEELAALDGLLERWLAALAGRAAWARAFREVMQRYTAEAQTAAGRAGPAGHRLAASLAPVAQKALRVADAFVSATDELDTAFRSLLVRAAAGGLSPWDRAEVDGVCVQMAGFARAEREALIGMAPLTPELPAGSPPDILALSALIDDATQLIAGRQTTLDGWQRLVQARVGTQPEAAQGA